MKCPICKKKMTGCYEDFVYYFNCEKCLANFDDKGNLIEFN